MKERRTVFLGMLLLSYSISVLKYFRPTILRTYDSFWSDVHSILLIRPTQEHVDVTSDVC